MLFTCLLNLNGCFDSSFANIPAIVCLFFCVWCPLVERHNIGQLHSGTWNTFSTRLQMKFSGLTPFQQTRDHAVKLWQTVAESKQDHHILSTTKPFSTQWLCSHHVVGFFSLAWDKRCIKCFQQESGLTSDGLKNQSKCLKWSKIGGIW